MLDLAMHLSDNTILVLAFLAIVSFAGLVVHLGYFIYEKVQGHKHAIIRAKVRDGRSLV